MKELQHEQSFGGEYKKTTLILVPNTESIQLEVLTPVGWVTLAHEYTEAQSIDVNTNDDTKWRAKMSNLGSSAKVFMYAND